MSCAVGQSVASTRSGAACLRPPVLDESLIREQTKVDHFWGESSAPYRVGEAAGRSEVFSGLQFRMHAAAYKHLLLLLAVLTR